MKVLTYPGRIEPLEIRIAPATLDVVAGSLTYTGGGIVANDLVLAVSGLNYTFTDTAETITLTAAAITAGFTGGGTNTVTGPDAAVDSVLINLGSGADDFTVNGVNDQLAVVDGAGTDTVTFSASTTSVGGNVLINAETVNLNSLVGAGVLTLNTNTISVNGAVSTTSNFVVQPLTAGRTISLGTENAASVSLTDAELDRITAPLLRIGSANAGNLEINAGITLLGGNVTRVSLITGGSITDTAAGSLVGGFELRATAVSGVTLDTPTNDLSIISGSVSGVGGFTFVDDDSIRIGTIDGVAGITVANGNVNLTGLQITLDEPITASTAGNSVFLTASGGVLDGNGAALNITASSLAIDAAATIGTSLDPMEISVGNLEARTGIGGIFLANTGSVLNIGGVSAAIDGVQTTNSGSIEISNDASIILAGTSAERIAAASGGVVVTTTGATADIAVRISNAASIKAVNNLTLTAGRDILLGSAATDTFGDIETNGTMTLTAGRDIILDEGTDVQVLGVGSFNGNAGRHFSILASDGTTGASISTNNRTINISTGAGGIYTQSSGVEALLNGGSGNINLTADQMVIANGISAGTGTVTLLARSAGLTIGLGSADSGGTLGLTDAELDTISAAALQIATSGTSPVSVNAVMSPNVPLLILGGTSVTGSGSINVDNLVISTAGNVDLNNTVSDVDFLEILLTGPDAPTFSFRDTNGFGLGIPGRNQSLLTPPASIVELDAGGTAVAFGDITVVLDVNGATPGTNLSQISITGTVELSTTTLFLDSDVALPDDTEFVLISNDGVEPIVGAFDNFAQGAITSLGGRTGFITYTGGDGNDVAFVTLPELTVQVVPGGKSVTFRDVDGDLVTVKTTKGVFDGSEFSGVELGANGAGQLQKLKLDGDFTGANITFTAVRTANGGNGFVNVGFLDATGVDLGVVSIPGDLGRIAAGTVGGDAKVPGLKALTLQSFGLLGRSTQGAGASNGAVIEGAMPKLTVAGDYRDIFLEARDGKIGTVVIGGNMVANVNTGFFSPLGIGSIKVGGDLRTVGSAMSISSGGVIGSVTVGGSILGSASRAISIFAFGQTVAPAKGIDLAIGKLFVGRTVEFLRLQVGDFSAENADASIGSITVGGNWIASFVQAGIAGGGDGRVGTNDDVKVGGRDNAKILSSIGSVTIKGQALGTFGSPSDMFGIVAEKIGKAKVGNRVFAFKADTLAAPSREAFFAASTGPGSGSENPAFDFTIREIGSTTPALALGVNLDISSDGKTATYTDVDGDVVTVKRSAGTFLAGDFTIVPDALTGGGQLQSLTLTAAPNDVVVNLAITAKPGPSGGNGFVNVGQIVGGNFPVGTITIAGDIGAIDAGTVVPGKAGTGSVTVQSMGLFGDSTGAASPLDSVFAGGLGKLTVATEFRTAGVDVSGAGAKLGAVSIGGNMIAPNPGGAFLSGANGIASVKIGGTVFGGEIRGGLGAIGTIAIGGDMIGLAGAAPAIAAFGQVTAPVSGLDVAIKSIIIKGNVENARIEAGTGINFANADASIGLLSVGRNWLGSSVLLGADDGVDLLIGTSDDKKVVGASSTRDESRFSTLSSLLIKGQAYGSTAPNDTFGIVAEQIVKGQVGKAVFKLDKGERDAADAFALASTGPDGSGLPSDLFLREISV